MKQENKTLVQKKEPTLKPVKIDEKKEQKVTDKDAKKETKLSEDKKIIEYKQE